MHQTLKDHDPAIKAAARPASAAWLSPINRRRLQNFKANRRGYWSLWIFLFLFVMCLFSEFLANDKPILISYDGGYYTPVCRGVP